MRLHQAMSDAVCQNGKGCSCFPSFFLGGGGVNWTRRWAGVYKQTMDLEKLMGGPDWNGHVKGVLMFHLSLLPILFLTKLSCCIGIWGSDCLSLSGASTVNTASL